MCLHGKPCIPRANTWFRKNRRWGYNGVTKEATGSIARINVLRIAERSDCRSVRASQLSQHGKLLGYPLQG